MDLVFDNGDCKQPKGHALLYFSSPHDTESVWVTYVVILPVAVDVSKYVPPFLMNQVGEFSGEELSSFAFPPAPERMDSYAEMERLAISRSDDVLFGGIVDPADVSLAMTRINEAVHEYAGMYAQLDEHASSVASSDLPSQGDRDGTGVSEVLYGLMSNSDKLGELTRLTGRLRFSVDGADISMIDEAEYDINLLAGHLPDTLNIPRLVQAVKSKDGRST